MPADYYVSTDDGRVHHIAGVTATPTLEVNDGVATTIFDGVYRDLLPYPNTGASAAVSYPFGPGWSATPDYAGTTTNSAYTTFSDDIITNTPPRFLEVKKTFWKFVTADGDYFFPENRVVGMSNNAPTY